MYHIFFIHSSLDGHLGCFLVLAIVNSAAMNIGVHVPFWSMFFSRYMPRSGIAGSYGSSIFSFLRCFLDADTETSQVRGQRGSTAHGGAVIRTRWSGSQSLHPWPWPCCVSTDGFTPCQFLALLSFLPPSPLVVRACQLLPVTLLPGTTLWACDILPAVGDWWFARHPLCSRSFTCVLFSPHSDPAEGQLSARLQSRASSLSFICSAYRGTLWYLGQMDFYHDSWLTNGEL